jgi:hypothetical protein
MRPANQLPRPGWCRYRWLGGIVTPIERGWNRLMGADVERIVSAVTESTILYAWPDHYGDGRASERICEVLSQFRT